RAGLDHDQFAERENLPLRIGGAQRGRGNSRVDRNAITENDTVAHLEAPALISGFDLPGGCEQRLRSATIIELDQSFEDQLHQAAKARRIRNSRVERLCRSLHANAQSSAIV